MSELQLQLLDTNPAYAGRCLDAVVRGRSTIFKGDCLELLKAVPDNSMDLICADLPYGTTKCKWDTIIPLKPMWEQIERIAKDRTAIVLFAQTPFDKVLGSSNLNLLKYEWIYEKPLATGFFNAKKMPMKALATF